MKFDRFHICNSLEELKRYLERDHDKLRKTETLNHEGKHLGRFFELGYGIKNPPTFTILSENGKDYDVIMQAKEEITDQDIISISLSPNPPSEYDLERAIKAWSRIQERRYFL